MVKDISLKMVLFSLLIGSLLFLPINAAENSLPPYCDQCAGMLDNQKLNEACNYWASYGRCPIGYTAESIGLFKNECPCKKTDLNTYFGTNAVKVYPTSTPVYSAPKAQTSSTSSKTTPVDINIQASDSGVTHWVKDATSLEGSFVNVRVTGVPNSDYYIWVKDTASMSGLAGDQPPSIALNDYTVKRDSASGPYEIGKFLFNGGNGVTVKQNVADDPDNHGTRYYALVRLNVEGSMNVLWNIPQNSSGKSFTIHVERKIGDEFESSEAIIRVSTSQAENQVLLPTSEPTQIYLAETEPTPLPDYLPFYTGGTTVYITNKIGEDATVVWTNAGSKTKVFVVNIPRESSKTVNIPVGTFDEFIRTNRWYKAGTTSFDSMYEYSIEYYYTSVPGSGTSLIPINPEDAPII